MMLALTLTEAFAVVGAIAIGSVIGVGLGLGTRRLMDRRQSPFARKVQQDIRDWNKVNRALADINARNGKGLSA